MDNIDTNDIELLRNRIYNAIEECIINPAYELDGGLVKASQQQFDGVLNYVGRVVFSYGNALKADNNKHIYNIPLIDCISNIYIELCQQYNKVSSIQGLSYITNIDYSYLMDWLYDYKDRAGNNPELSKAKANIIKRVQNNREYSLKNKLISTSQAVGLLGVGNHEFHWSSDTIANEERARAIALNELPTMAIDTHKTQKTKTLTTLDNL